MRLHHIRSNRWLAVTVMALLLALVTAPVLTRMDCLMSGRSSFAIGNMDECCPEDLPVERPVIKAICCEFEQTSPGKAHFLPHSSVFIHFVASITYAPIVASATDIGTLNTEALASRPPPLSVPHRLSRIGLLLL